MITTVSGPMAPLSQNWRTRENSSVDIISLLRRWPNLMAVLDSQYLSG